MDNTHEWCKEGIEPQIDILKGISIEDNYPNFTERIRRLEVIHVPNVADLPPEAATEKEKFQILGIKSLILVPIVYGQNLIGFLGFDSVKTKKTWKEADIRLLKMVGEIIANALERKRADQEIQNLQHYNRGLIEVSLDPLVTFNHEGIILDVNEATIKATGRNREELIGTPFADYFTDPEKAHKGAMMVFETGEVRDYELVMKARDGIETVVAYNASVYEDQTGKVVGAFAAARDITERKKSQKELEETIEKLEAYTSRINRLMTTTLEQVTKEKAKGVILDITGIPSDIEITQPLINIARYARELGATCVITGIKYDVERELIEAGVILSPITTERSLHDGLRYTIAIIDES
jgi:PAS domain S-box-containing protein